MVCIANEVDDDLKEHLQVNNVRQAGDLLGKVKVQVLLSLTGLKPIILKQNQNRSKEIITSGRDHISGSLPNLIITFDWRREVADNVLVFVRVSVYGGATGILSDAVQVIGTRSEQLSVYYKRHSEGSVKSVSNLHKISEANPELYAQDTHVPCLKNREHQHEQLHRVDEETVDVAQRN